MYGSKPRPGMNFPDESRAGTRASARVMSFPRRVACLTAETTELAFSLIHPDRIVGVSGFAVRPPEAKSKPKVCAFTTVQMEKIRELSPDLILGFSNLQKDIARDLIAEGFNVFIINPRRLDEVEDSFIAIGRLLGEEQKAVTIRENFRREIEQIAAETRGALNGFRPRVYFEEWDEPLITGIAWVHDLIERMGAENVFADRSLQQSAKQRAVSSEEVLEADPDVLIGSWCGKKVDFEKIRSRPGWDRMKAVRENHLYEVRSSDLLAPGLSLVHGARALAEILLKTAHVSIDAPSKNR
jgi:iron complex transport system substrate-binding protein